jgi:hypothetical protein
MLEKYKVQVEKMNLQKSILTEAFLPGKLKNSSGP